MHRMSLEYGDQTAKDIAALEEHWGAASKAEVIRRAIAMAAAVSKRGARLTVIERNGKKTDVVLV